VKRRRDHSLPVHMRSSGRQQLKKLRLKKASVVVGSLSKLKGTHKEIDPVKWARATQIKLGRECAEKERGAIREP